MDAGQEVVDLATEFDRVVVQLGLYVELHGKRHINVEGWTWLGQRMGVSAGTTYCEHYDGAYCATVALYDDEGRVVGGGVGYCADDERPWGSRPAFARAAMAQTRAVGRALRQRYGHLAVMAGYAGAAAEEMPAEEAPQPWKLVVAGAQEAGLEPEDAQDILVQLGYQTSRDVPAAKVDEVVARFKMAALA